ncbi:type IV secretion system DNA-binding domain-containing protein, partial [Thiolapillus sp.]
MTAPTIPSQSPEPDIPAVLLLTGVITLAALAGGWWVACWLYYLEFLPATATAVEFIPFLGHWLASLISHNRVDALPVGALIVAGAITTVIGILTFVILYRKFTPPTEIHVRGRQLLTGKAGIRQAKKETAEAIERSGQGLEILPVLAIDEDRETRHIMVLGSPGSGKTTFIRPLIEQARERGDRSFIFDNKSDFTKTHSQEDDVIFIAPWDSRGWAWDIARDVQNLSDAREFSTALIELGKDPMWGLAARQVLTALVRKCQVEQPGEWGFADIVAPLSGGATAIKNCVDQYNPEASSLIEDAASKTAQSILTTLVSYLAPVFSLADAWGRCKTPGRISFRAWLADGWQGQKTIVLQGNGQYAELQQAVSRTIFRTIAREMSSPSITDCRPHERRIWLFLDEFPQLGKLENFSQFLEVGRSKGFRVVLGLQDLAQIKSVYDNNIFESWSSMVGSYWIGRTQGVEFADWISELIGKRSVRHYSASHSASLYANESPSRTDQYQKVEEFVVFRDDLASELGPEKNGVVGLWLSGSEYVYQLVWPYLSPELTAERRPAQVPARWTAPDYPSAAEQTLHQSAAAGGHGNPDKRDSKLQIKEPWPPGKEDKEEDPDENPKIPVPKRLHENPEFGDSAIEKLGKEAVEEAAENAVLSTLGLDQLEPISQVFKILDATLELMNDQDAAAPVQLIDDNDK